jgi:integrase
MAQNRPPFTPGLRVPSPPWLLTLSAGFRAHRQGRQGWFIQLNRDRLRVTSTELPPRPGETATSTRARSLILRAPPGPATITSALAEACDVFDRVMAGTFTWPGPDDARPEGTTDPASPANLERLIAGLRDQLVGERMTQGTWDRTWAPYLSAVVATAGETPGEPTPAMLARLLRRWPPNSRARQMAHDRARALWRHAGWPWPEVVAAMRGNGKAAAHPAGARAMTDAEIATLRERITASRQLTASDLLAWDLIVVFGLRPVELQGLELQQQDGTLVATVTRSKRSSRGTSGARTVPAVPPAGWPADCHGLLDRWHRHGLPPGLLRHRSPGQSLTQQLGRLLMPEGLSSYAPRHAFAIRLAEIGLNYREAAELMGHSPATHVATYGRRLALPDLMAKASRLARERQG